MVKAHSIRRTLWLTGLLLLGASHYAFATLNASIDRNTVMMGESFTLTLESDVDGNDTPDLSPLDPDFKRLDTRTLRVTAGNTIRSLKWQTTLMPRRIGTLTIPPITVNGERSQPIDLKILPSNSSSVAPQGDELLALDVSAEPKSVYIQQQLIYTVKLYRRVDLADGSRLSEPELDDAVIKRLDEDHEYQTTRNGTRYIVFERRYAIYPQKSGTFTIPPLQLDGRVVVRQRGGSGIFGMDPFAQNTQIKRVRSQPVTFTVKPAPITTTDTWLPTGHLQLAENWSPNPPGFTVGEPITRTLAIVADGLTAAQLPVLSSKSIDGVKQYPDQPLLKDTVNANGISGVRQEKIALIPTRPGKLTLPAIEVQWWNTDKEELETASLPARTVQVAPAARSTAPQTTSPAPPLSTQPEAAPTTVVANPPTHSGLWPWLSAILAIGWLGTAFAWWRQCHQKGQPDNGQKGDTNRLHTLERQVKDSCRDNNPDQAQDTLLSWAKKRWPKNPPLTLIALAERVEKPLADAIRELERHRYSRETAAWQGENLCRAFREQKRKTDDPVNTENDGLEPLHPD